MDIVKEQSENSLTIKLLGRLDTITAPELQDALIPEIEKEKDVTLDFAELEYVSSAGLRVLLIGEQTAQENNGSLTLVNVSEDIMEVFEMTGFSEVLNIE